MIKHDHYLFKNSYRNKLDHKINNYMPKLDPQLLYLF